MIVATKKSILFLLLLVLRTLLGFSLFLALSGLGLRSTHLGSGKLRISSTSDPYVYDEHNTHHNEIAVLLEEGGSGHGQIAGSFQHDQVLTLVSHDRQFKVILRVDENLERVTSEVASIGNLRIKRNTIRYIGVVLHEDLEVKIHTVSATTTPLTVVWSSMCSENDCSALASFVAWSMNSNSMESAAFIDTL